MGTRPTGALRKSQLGAAEQSRPKKKTEAKKSAKLKHQEVRKASTNLLALQGHILTLCRKFVVKQEGALMQNS